MGEKRSVFFDEWQACLRSHYIHVLRSGDDVTEPTLRHVLLQTGLSEDELIELHEMVGIAEPETFTDEALPPAVEEVPAPAAEETPSPDDDPAPYNDLGEPATDVEPVEDDSMDEDATGDESAGHDESSGWQQLSLF